MKTRITQIFNIEFPLIQAGMVWCSGWRLASAVSNSGGLGIIGAGSMYPEVLKEHIQKCKKATDKPFAVNVPLLYPDIEKLMQIIVEEGVKIVFTSAGNPKTWTSILKEKGILGLVNEVGLNENQARHVMLWCQNECQRQWGYESFNINKDMTQQHKSPYSEYSYRGYRT